MHLSSSQGGNTETRVSEAQPQKRRVDLPSLRAKAAAHAYAASMGAVSLPPKRNHRPSRTAGDNSIVRRVHDLNERTLQEAQQKQRVTQQKLNSIAPVFKSRRAKHEQTLSASGFESDSVCAREERKKNTTNTTMTLSEEEGERGLEGHGTRESKRSIHSNLTALHLQDLEKTRPGAIA